MKVNKDSGPAGVRLGTIEKPLKAHGIVQIPVRHHKGLWFLPVSINGKDPVELIVDSGAQSSGVTLEVAAKSGFAGTKERRGVMGSSGAPVDFSTFEAESLAVGPLVLRNLVVSLLRLEGLGGEEGVTVAGMLGYNFLARVVVALDYAAATVAVEDSEGFQAPSSAFSLDLDLSRRVPAFRGTIHGQEVKLALDTGNSGPLVLAKKAAERLGIPQQGAATIETDLEGIGGRELALMTRISSLRVVDKDYPGVLVAVQRGGQDNLTRFGLDGVLGRSFLRRFTVILDYPHEKIWLIPGEKVWQPEAADKSGMELRVRGNEIVLTRLHPGSSAEEAGLKVGDAVLSVGGIVATASALHSIEELLAGPAGGAVAVQYKRGGREGRATFLLTEILSCE